MSRIHYWALGMPRLEARRFEDNLCGTPGSFTDIPEGVTCADCSSLLLDPKASGTSDAELERLRLVARVAELEAKCDAAHAREMQAPAIARKAKR